MDVPVERAGVTAQTLDIVKHDRVADGAVRSDRLAEEHVAADVLAAKDRHELGDGARGLLDNRRTLQPRGRRVGTMDHNGAADDRVFTVEHDLVVRVRRRHGRGGVGCRQELAVFARQVADLARCHVAGVAGVIAAGVGPAPSRMGKRRCADSM